MHLPGEPDRRHLVPATPASASADRMAATAHPTIARDPARSTAAGGLEAVLGRADRRRTDARPSTRTALVAVVEMSRPRTRPSSVSGRLAQMRWLTRFSRASWLPDAGRGSDAPVGHACLEAPRGSASVQDRRTQRESQPA